ncbi:hypothetical protein FJZ31_22460 [Candidatus Poribacteria bacterium]|nr:hypothetical protein [Candidatus Poribacteria bacterium]
MRNYDDIKQTYRFKLSKIIYHIPNFVKLFWRLFQDPRVPIYQKVIPIVFGALAVIVATIYFIGLKLDLIPDIFPLIGVMDDIVISIAIIFVPGAWVFVKVCPKDVVLEHVERIDKERR